MKGGFILSMSTRFNLASVVAKNAANATKRTKDVVVAAVDLHHKNMSIKRVKWFISVIQCIYVEQKWTISVVE